MSMFSFMTFSTVITAALKYLFIGTSGSFQSWSVGFRLVCCRDSRFCYIPLENVGFFCFGMCFCFCSLLGYTQIANTVSWLASQILVQIFCPLLAYLYFALYMHISGVSQRSGQSLYTKLGSSSFWFSLFQDAPVTFQ